MQDLHSGAIHKTNVATDNLYQKITQKLKLVRKLKMSIPLRNFVSIQITLLSHVHLLLALHE